MTQPSDGRRVLYLPTGPAGPITFKPFKVNVGDYVIGFDKRRLIHGKVLTRFSTNFGDNYYEIEISSMIYSSQIPICEDNIALVCEE